MRDELRDRRMEKKLDDIAVNISEINVTLAKQSVILEEHQRRSLANEEAVEVLKKQHNMIAGALKLLSIIAALAAVVELFIR